VYKNILLPIDLGDTDSWSKSLPVSIEFAKLFDATLRIMTVVPDFGMSIVGSFFPEGYEQKVLEQARQTLHDFVSEHVPDTVKVQHVVGHGTVYDEILRIADDVSADLIILGASRPRAGKFLLGPNAARVVRDANCCVHVTRS
jgi:nucleotide-binding universal stress UspA family protein